MKSRLTNVGKKEQRQIDQILTKAVNEDGTRGKEVEARTAPKAHKLKSGRRSPKS